MKNAQQRVPLAAGHKLQSIAPERSPGALFNWLLVPIVLMVLTGATLISTGLNIDSRLESASGLLRAVAWLLTLPVSVSSAGDLRGALMPVGAGILLALLGAWVLLKRRPVDGMGGENNGSRDTSARLALFAWIACVLFTIASSVYNDTWPISRGWIMFLMAGGAWGLVLSCTSQRMRRAILTGMIAIGAIACGISLWHRQVTNLLYIDWPIGPLTISAAIGAVVAALAVGDLIAAILSGNVRSPSQWWHFAIDLAGLVTAIAVMVICGRTGPWIGLLAGVGLMVAAIVFQRYRARTIRWAVGITAMLGVAAVVGYIARVASLSQDAKARSMGIRLIYWSKILQELPNDAILGVGPDMFGIRMTDLLARQRAEMPHYVHGYVDSEAHNEWLQAFYELGVLGGLAYVAIPILSIVSAIRGWWSATDAERDWAAANLVLAGALCVIVVMECGSINLRHPVLPAWYWTLIGLSFAPAVREGRSPRPRGPLRRAVAPGLAILVGLVFIVLCWIDVRRSMLYAEGMAVEEPANAIGTIARARGRLGAANWLQCEYDYGMMLTRHAEVANNGMSGHASERWQATLRQWGLDAIAPAYLDTGSQHAKALFFTGDSAGCMDRLRRQLSELNPYDPLANLLAIHFGKPIPAERFKLIQHGLREADIDQDYAAAIRAGAAEGEFTALVNTAADAAESDLKNLTWRDPLGPEVLRIAAQLDFDAGRIEFASRRQLAAAEAYKGLRDKNATARRRVFAETDAAWKAALYLFQANPLAHQKSFELICEAERVFANEMSRDVLGVQDPELGYVGGEVILREMPSRFEAMWRFSAAMHLLQGRWKAAVLRVTYSLPAERRADIAVIDEQRALASWLVQIFEKMPASQRPSSFETLRQFAERTGS